MIWDVISQILCYADKIGQFLILNHFNSDG